MRGLFIQKLLNKTYLYLHYINLHFFGTKTARKMLVKLTTGAVEDGSTPGANFTDHFNRKARPFYINEFSNKVKRSSFLFFCMFCNGLQESSLVRVQPGEAIEDLHFTHSGIH
jgi:hypothetical protein